MIGGFIKKYGWQYIPGILFLLLSAYLQMLAPRLLGAIIDMLRQPSINARGVYMTSLAMLAAAFATFVTRFAWRQFINGNARNLEAYLRQSLFTHLQKMDARFYSQSKTGDLMAYAVNDINAIRMAFGPAFAMLINGVVLSAMSVGNMTAGVDGRLTAFAMAPVPVILIILLFMGREVGVRFGRVQEAFAAISDRVQENISGLRVIKAYVQEDAEVARFEGLNKRTRDANLDMVKVSASMNPAVELLFGISFTVGLVYGSGLVRSGAITLGDFVAFNGYLALIVQPVRSVSRIINVFSRGTASFKRYSALLGVKPAIEDGPGVTGPVASGVPHVAVTDLDFIYPGDDRFALRGVSFTLARGGSLGVFGRTGSGKTTLANLLVKLYRVPDGKIIVSGADINEYTLEQLRGSAGYAPQDNFLFSAGIGENIRFFNDGYTDGQVEDAARRAGIYDEIVSFPEGFDTQVGERGMSLSGGQKQRVCIARALIGMPELLVLDDSLSSVDVETEAAIIRSLHGERPEGESLIIIAHRVSALALCDEIIVLDAGEIVERGTHEELVRAGGFYASVAREQADGGVDL